MNDEKFVILSKRSKSKQLGIEYIIMHVGLMFLVYYFVV